jgi:hypothetical protein
MQHGANASDFWLYSGTCATLSSLIWVKNMSQMVKCSKSMAKGAGCTKVVRETKDKRRNGQAYKIQIYTPTQAGQSRNYEWEFENLMELPMAMF